MKKDVLNQTILYKHMTWGHWEGGAKKTHLQRKITHFNHTLVITQLKMGWAYTLGVGVYIRKGCKS